MKKTIAYKSCENLPDKLNCNIEFDDDGGDILLEQLKCPICVEVPLGEIYQCRNGHTLCRNCLRSVKVCPQCRLPFEKDGQLIRVRALESLLESVKIACPYKSNGCMEKIRRKDIDSHVKRCLHNGKSIHLCKKLGYNCNFLTNALSTDCAMEHFEKVHKAVVINDNCVGIHIENFKHETENLVVDGIWQPIIMNTQESQFIVLTFFNAEDGTVSWASLKMNHDEKDADCPVLGDEIELQIQNQLYKPLPLKWKMFPVPLLELERVKVSELGLQRMRVKDLNEKYVSCPGEIYKENGMLQLKITVSTNSSSKTGKIYPTFRNGNDGLKMISEITTRKSEEEAEGISLAPLWNSITQNYEKVARFLGTLTEESQLSRTYLK